MKILKNPIAILLCIALLALILRVINLQDNILFAYDQARDAQRVYNMVYKGDIKIVGPETDIQGVFNGPLLYYFLAPIYFFSHFDPNVAAFFFVLVNVGTLFLVYWAAKLLFKKESTALLASLFWAVSYEQIFFARFISNASPMSTTTTIFFIGLALFFLKKKQLGLPLSALGISLAIHCNFYFIYLFLFYPLFFLIFKQKPAIKTIIISLCLFGVLLAPWIITELKWGFIGTKSLTTYFMHQGTSALTNNPLTFLFSIMSRYYHRISQGIYFSILPHKALGFILLIVLSLHLAFMKKSQFILFFLLWLLNTLPLFAFNSGVHNNEVINGSVVVPITILFAAGIVELKSIKSRIIQLCATLGAVCIVFYGLSYTIKQNFTPSGIPLAAPITLKTAKQVIDYTYVKSDKRDFAICSISEPLFINTLWSFLYSTYGKEKYGYLPYWTGQKQILNESFIPYAQKKYTTKFIIRESLSGIPDFAPRSTYYIEDKQNTLVEEKTFNVLAVQQRKFSKENGGNTSHYSIEQRRKIEEDIGIVPQFSCDNIYE